MKLVFCTLFDTGYLTRGLVLYESLLNHCTDFHLYVFAFDSNCFNFLRQLGLKNITVISPDEFEDNELKEVKNKRTRAEFCWTSTPSTVWYVLKKFNEDHCTYIDADMLFYNNPEVLIKEVPEHSSVLITEHRYSNPSLIQEQAGIYNVQFVFFKNSPDGLKICKWWRDACIEWCYDRFEDGKFGDQKYLDNWTQMFGDSIHVLRHEGGGLATWNIQQYKIRRLSSVLYVINKTTKKKYSVIFFHFHALKFFSNNVVFLTPDQISWHVKKTFYFPYINLLRKMEVHINNSYPEVLAEVNFKPSPKLPYSFRDKLYLVRKLVMKNISEHAGVGLFRSLRNLFHELGIHNYYYR